MVIFDPCGGVQFPGPADLTDQCSNGVGIFVIFKNAQGFPQIRARGDVASDSDTKTLA